MVPFAPLVSRLGAIGFERTRRALAALALSLFVALYGLLALNPPPGWSAAFLALSACYLVAFLGVAAEWFWGRWFAMGLGWSGLMVAIASLVMVGWMPPLVIYGALHGLIVLQLAGPKMAARYDLQEPWRQRYRMDELGVARLRKTVTRASASLPSLILWALGPKEPGQGMIVGLAALGLAVLGMRGLVRLRSWSLLAFVAAGGIVALGTRYLAPSAVDIGGGWLATAFIAAALVPFAGPALRFVRARA